MQITHLNFNNFKGRDFDKDLFPVTAITGNNFARKTSVPMAIRLALRGSLPPPIGTKGIYSLAGNPDAAGEMSICVTVDGNKDIQHSWKKDAKGKVSYKGSIPPEVQMPELLMEPKLFFGKTSTERTNIIFGCCQGLDFQRDSLVLALEDISEGVPEVCRAAKQEVTGYIDGFAKDITPQDLCARLIEWIKLRSKTAADECKRAQGALAAFQNSVTDRVSDQSEALRQAREKLSKLVVPSASSLETLKFQLSNAESAFAAFVESCPFDVSTLEKEILRLQEATKVCPVEDLQESLDEATENRTRFSQKVESISSQVSKIETDISNLDAAPCCPVCKASKKGWASNARASLTKLLESVKADRDAAQGEYNNASKVADALIKFKANQDSLINVIGWRSSYLEKEKAIKELKAKVDAWKPDPYAEQRAQVQAEIAGLEEKQRKWDQFKADKTRRDTHEKEYATNLTRLDTFKAAERAITRVQSKLIDSAFGKVLTVANHCIAFLLNSPLQFRDGELGRLVSQKDVDIGCVSPVGSWISHECFSGTEELIAYAAFSIALCQSAPIKIVIMDELGRLHGQRKADLISHMITLVRAEVIDQVILVDVDPSLYRAVKSPEFGLIEL